MPTDRLATAEIETAIAKVIAGTPVTDVASAVGMQSVALADAVEVYRQVGRHPLDHVAPDWWQVYIRFADWEQAERAVADHVADPQMGSHSGHPP